MGSLTNAGTARAPQLLPPRARRRKERYKLLKLIGQGGTGAVYKAVDLELDRIIAVKLLHPMLAGNELYVNLLKREVVVASQISHPNIVRVFDVGELLKTTLITMAFVQGENLASILHRDGALSTPRIAHFCQQICSGLAEAHRCGVVHRDLKPQNLLIDHQSRLFISDFGLAHAASAVNYDAIESSSRPGTLRYMSPEQFHALPADPRSDLFSFGLILYEMLTGTALDVDRDATGPVAVDRKTGLPASLPEAVSAPLAAIALRCLAQNPAERYQSASEILESLPQDRYAVSAVEVFANRKKLTAGAVAVRSRVRNHPRIPIAVVGLVLLAGAGIWSFQNSNQISASKKFDRLCREATSELMNADDTRSVEKAAKLFRSAAALKSSGTVYEGIAKAELRLFELRSDRQALVQARSAVQRAEKLDTMSRSLALLHAEIDLADRATGPAVSRLNRILSSEGPSDEVLRLLAKAQFLAGDSVEALASWRRAVEINPNFWLNHNVFGAALMALGQPEKAEAEFRKVIQLNPDSYVGYSNLGAAYVAAGEFHRAIAVTEKSLTLWPTAPQYNNLGTALYYTGTCYGAIQLFRKALELNSNSELYFGNLGEAYRCAGDSDNARAAYGNALERAQDALRGAPSNARLEARVCVYLAKMGRMDEARRLLSSVLAKAPANPEILYSKAVVYLVGNQFSEAASAIQAALAEGYSIKVAARDPELKPLWADPDLKRRFQAELDREPRASSELTGW